MLVVRARSQRLAHISLVLTLLSLNILVSYTVDLTQMYTELRIKRTVAFDHNSKLCELVQDLRFFINEQKN